MTEDGTEMRTVGWPVERAVTLTLDFECDFGTALPENRYEAVTEVERLVSLLEEYEIPLTCFVQTALFEERPDAVEPLREADTTVSFHPHSHTHKPRNETSVAWELEESTTRFEDFFGEAPVGYRFPNGNVRAEDYRLLANFGYKFDASVFPSWRPGKFNNTGAATTPTYRSGDDLFEIPFTIYSDRLRIPTALSYCQVLGRPYWWVLSRWPPSVVVLNIHMHDLVTPSTIQELPARYRVLYSRNVDGLSLLEKLIGTFQHRGYAFETLDVVHEMLREDVVNQERFC
jgi:peptidoglycan/xylan/chitin deacetylase (PgdA/CDA1 family)